MPAHLTSRQREVCGLISQGFTAREIGTALGIGVRTVEDHRAAAFKKLGVRKAVDMVKIMFSEGKFA